MSWESRFELCPGVLTHVVEVEVGRGGGWWIRTKVSEELKSRWDFEGRRIAMANPRPVD